MVMFPVHQVWPKPSCKASERGKKTRQREEEVGRQHQRMDRPRVRQVPEGSGEQGKMEKTGCKIICGAPATLAVKGLMMMMMMIPSFTTTPAFLHWSTSGLPGLMTAPACVRHLYFYPHDCIFVYLLIYLRVDTCLSISVYLLEYFRDCA